MRFPDQFLDDIRDRLRISEVVGQRVAFDKKKTNAARGDYWGCCPFHGEKTPSFHCEDKKGRYYCFGCGASGDHFRFLTELDGIHFSEAVERLAAQAGLPMPVLNPREQEREEQRKSLYDVMELAAKFFREELHEAGGAEARSYLRGRGLTAGIQQEFGIGFAPNSRNSLKQFLAEHGVDAAQMEACGLVNHGPDIPVSYDKFRGRIMFPIPDSRGRTIAFGGRALDPDALAKYMNSPETELFHKSNVLFNFARARKPAYDKKQVIAVEGYMDVIALHSAGFDNSVAPLGTALTERQMALLWRMHDEPLLCFDGDGAGLKAAHRAIDMILPVLEPGRSARFVMLPDGMDPDDLLKASGPEAMQELLESALPLSRMIWDREIASGNLETPERRAAFEQQIKRVIGAIRHEDVRRYYSDDVREKLRNLFSPSARGASGQGNFSNAMGGGQYGKASSGRNASRSKWGDKRGTGRSATGASSALLASRMLKKHASAMSLREAALIGGLVFHPALGALYFEEVSQLQFQSADAQALQSALLDAFAGELGEQGYPEREVVNEQIVTRGLGDTLKSLHHQLQTSQLWQLLPDAALEDARDGWQQAFLLHTRNQTLNAEIKAAERALADEDSDENLARILTLQQELSRIDGMDALIEGFGVSSGRPVKGF